MYQQTFQKNRDKVRKDYNKIAPHFALTRKCGWSQLAFLTSYIKKNSSVIDIGCGTGRIYAFLKSLAMPFSYVGIDISEGQLEQAKKEYPQTTFIQGDMTNLPFKDNQYTTAFMIASLHHLSTPAERLQALQEAHRVLEMNGLLLMTNWNLYQKKFYKDRMKNIVRSIATLGRYSLKDFFIPWKNSQGKIMAQRYYYAFSKKEIEELCVKAGFKVEKNIYTKEGEEGTIFSAYNLLIIARKI